MKIINNKYIQITKDVLKRSFMDLCRRMGRLKTPMDIFISTLNAYGYMPRNVIALELFGMHGLWHTKDYAHLCSYLEFYEINPIYANVAKIFLKKAVVNCTDSIEAVKKHNLLRTEYNFIVIDNPGSAPFGKNYYEHFDIFPEILEYINKGILVIDFLYNIKGLNLSQSHLQKRNKFYNNFAPSIKEGVDVYKKILNEKNLKLIDYIFTPGSQIVGYLGFVIGKL